MADTMSRLNERGHPPPRTLTERTFAQRVRQSLQPWDAKNLHCREIGVRRAKMEQALTGKPHSQRFVQVEVVNAKQLDVFLQLGEDAVFDSDALRCYLVGCGDALDPVDDVGNAECDDDHHPLPKTANDSRVTREQRLFSLCLFRGQVGRQIGVAEPALDRHRFNGFPAYRTRFCFLTHLRYPSLGLRLLVAGIRLGPARGVAAPIRNTLPMLMGLYRLPGL